MFLHECVVDFHVINVKDVFLNGYYCLLLVVLEFVSEQISCCGPVNLPSAALSLHTVSVYLCLCVLVCILVFVCIHHEHARLM